VHSTARLRSPAERPQKTKVAKMICVLLMMQ